ncbi:MAG TPA: S8 family serine peptidase [Pyrinomonadaceae bacterium]|nr:S8 family serine peptidase [Pyrinomonadaceae bacterium]
MSLSSLSRRTPRAENMRRGLAVFLSFLLLAVALMPARDAFAAAASSYKSRSKVEPVGEYVPGEVLVRFRADASVIEKTRDAVSAEGGADVVLPVTDETGNEISVRVERFDGSDIVSGLRLARVAADDTLRAIDGLNARSDVLYAEPNYIWRKTATPNDPRYGEQYAMTRISAPQAWDITTGDPNVVVGVIDGGVNNVHQDLAPNMWVNPGDSTVDNVDNDGNGFIDDVNGWDFANGDRTVFDSQPGDDHGTHVAGTIGARGNNGIGVTGVNWQVKIMSIKVLGPDGGSTSDIIGGYNYARMMKQRGVNLRVLNNSYGGAGGSLSARDAILQLNNVGILFVAAAGNDGVDNFGFPHFPSNYDLPNVLAVASTNTADPDGLSSFSNFGGRVVSMGAPGSQILSTTPNNTYSFFSGTSMATPHVSGGAALVLAANPNIDMEHLRGVLAYSGDVLASLQGKTTTGRRLNVFNSIQSAREAGGVVDTTAPAAASNFVHTAINGRTVTLSWNAPGDDGNSGTAADYDFYFVSNTNQRTLMPSTILPAPAGTHQSVNVDIPYRNFQGTIELRTYDNAGNSSTASIFVTVGQNHGTDPYVFALGSGGGLSTDTSERLLLNADDVYSAYFLPFGFDFYRSPRGQQIMLSSNGAIYFPPYATQFGPPTRENGDSNDVPSSIAGLNGQNMIAGLWDDIDLRTCFRADAGIYVVKPDATRIIFRWQGVPFTAPGCPATPVTNPTNPINFEIELRQDGTIITRYGSGNNNLHPVVGISGGEPEAYVIASHTSEFPNSPISLNNAASVTFTPRPTTIPATFQLSQANYAVSENAGTATIRIVRGGDAATTQSVNYTTSNGTAIAGINGDYIATSGTLTFAPGETFRDFTITINNDAIIEPHETLNIALSNPTNGASLGAQNTATLTIQNDDAAGPNTVQFNAPNTTVGENISKITLTVTRTGDTANAATVFYQTNDFSANDRSDYTAALGTLRFAAGETTKSFDVFITDDVFNEGAESFTVTLTSPFQTSLGGLNAFTVNITDNDAVTGANPVKDPTFDSTFFVRQHYIDFFNREPDAGGLAFWKNQIDECTTQECREVRRINVSAAFFVSGEFQQTGYLVYRAHQVAFNTGETLRLRDFLADQREIGRGVIIGQPGAEALLEANTVAFFNEFVTRPQFNALYGGLNNTQYVDALNANTGNSLAQGERDALINGLNVGTETRATVLRKVAQNQTFTNLHRNRAFVLMQYFGYLRRNPNDSPNTDYSGYFFWLTKLNQFGGNYISAEMVKAFITSTEYQQRFGPS